MFSQLGRRIIQTSKAGNFHQQYLNSQIYFVVFAILPSHNGYLKE